MKPELSVIAWLSMLSVDKRKGHTRLQGKEQKSLFIGLKPEIIHRVAGTC